MEKDDIVCHGQDGSGTISAHEFKHLMTHIGMFNILYY